MATTHIDYRKIDYDQLLDKPIIRTDASVDTLTTAGVYDKGDGKRYLVSVDGQTITQIIEEKDGYQERTSTDGGTTWGTWDTVQFSDADHKWDVVVISGTEPVDKRETTAWIDTSDDNKFKVYDGTSWLEVAGQTIQTETMPTASEDLEGKIVQYEGVTNVNYTHGYFYECVGDGQDPETFSRVRIDVQPNNAAASSVSYDNTTSGMVATNVQDAIDEIDTSVDTINTTITNIQSDITDIKNIVEVTTMDTPSEDNEGSIVQYKGATNANYTHGYFYECVSDGQTPATYSWERIDVQPAGAGDEHEFITQAAYDLLTPAQKAAKVYMIKEEGVPGSGLTAGAGIDITNNTISADMTTAVYDNTTSGATATNVQDALDEVFQRTSGGSIDRGDMVMTTVAGSSDTAGYVGGTDGTNTHIRIHTPYGIQKVSQNTGSANDTWIINNGYLYYSYGNVFHKTNLSTGVDETATVYTGSYTVYHKWSDGYMYFLNNSVNPKVVKKVYAADLTIEDSTEVEYNSIPSGLYYKGLYYSQDNDDYVAVNGSGTEVKRYSGIGTINGIYNDKLYRNVGDVAYAIATI